MIANPFIIPASVDVAEFPPVETTDESGRAIAERGSNSDLDASLRFAQDHAGNLRYCPGIGWLYWDEKRWTANADHAAVELSKRSARKWLLRCAKSENADLKRGAVALESAAHIKNAVDLARSDPRLAIKVLELDRDPWKLNVLNGTLDLRTGALHAHKRDDYITKLAPVAFEPNATHEALTRFLGHIEKSTPGMSDFLARCFGVALTGNAEAETLFLLQGDAGSSKTTMLESVASSLGDYAVKMQFESFCQNKNSRSAGGASPDLVSLRGARLAYASEGDQAARLDAGLVKTLTGNEPVTARALYSEPMTFPQTWKLWLVSNFDPKADSEDTGIWRRMLKLQFAAVPQAERDPAVKRMLTTDPTTRSALLNWALAGCLDWQARGGGREGLAPPDAVRAVTDAYRLKQDTLSGWWDDLLAQDAELLPRGSTPVGQLRKHYETWAEDNGAGPVYVKRFAAYLESKGLESKRGTGGVRSWIGLSMN